MNLRRKRHAVNLPGTDPNRTDGRGGVAENQEKTGKKSTIGNFPSFMHSTARHGFAVRMPNPNAGRR